MAPLDRPFEYHARLNRSENFDTGVHEAIVQHFKTKNPISADSKILSTKQFESEMKRMSRNVGVNYTTGHPTVEYRYLTSLILGEKNGPEKVIDYIKYFAAHTASRANKNQIIVNGIHSRVVFTRQHGSIRIDYQNKSKSIPQSGRKVSDIRSYPQQQKPEELGITKWKFSNPLDFELYSMRKSFEKMNKELPYRKHREFKVGDIVLIKNSAFKGKHAKIIGLSQDAAKLKLWPTKYTPLTDTEREKPIFQGEPEIFLKDIEIAKNIPKTYYPDVKY